MYKIREIYKYLCELAPLELQMDFDNSGFQLGKAKNEINRVLLSLDVTDDVVEEAIEIGAGLIISHHPLIFRAIKSVSDFNIEGKRLIKLIENNIAVISMHTNLDISTDGVNDVLIRLLGAEPEAALDSYGCGRIGNLKNAIDFDAFLSICKEKLNANGLRYYKASDKVSKLAVMGGAGGDSVEEAALKGCDTYVTADIKYHQFLSAAELGINLIDADHFCTENPVIYALSDKLSKAFPHAEFIISKKHKQTISFI